MTHTTPPRRTAIATGAVHGTGTGTGAATAKRLADDGSAVGVTDPDEADCADTVEAVTGADGAAPAAAADDIAHPASFLETPGAGRGPSEARSSMSWAARWTEA